MVTIDDLAESRESKLLLMNDAINDPLYLADLKEVMDDFNVDDEDL